MAERAYRPEELMNGQKSGNHWLAVRSRRAGCNPAPHLCVTNLRQEPGAAIPQAEICAGDAG